jgi:hypothetical protein
MGEGATTRTSPAGSAPARRRPRWVFPLLLLLQFVALLVVIELFLACFFPVKFRRPFDKVPETTWTTLLHRKSTQPGVPYELNPGAVGELRGASIHVNSLGFRGKEISVVKPPGTIRIVSMGASIGFGWTVNDDETYPAQLERMLNERAAEHGSDRHYEVLNFGVGGYATRDEVAVLAAKALPLDPDLVIIDYHPNGPESEPIQPLHQVFHEPVWWEKWNLLRLLAYGRRFWGIATLGDGDQYRYLASPKGPHWPELLKALDRARDLCAPRGLHVVMPVFPTYGALADWQSYSYHDLTKQAVDAIRSRGFIAVDMFPVFANSGFPIQEQPGVPGIAVDAEHPGKTGLELTARELMRVILEHHQELLNLPPP